MLKSIKIPRKDKRLAELIGVILGDGHISYYNPRKKVATYHIRIAGNSIKDSDYFYKYLKPLTEEIFKTESSIHKSNVFNCIYLTITGKRVVEFFIKVGLKPGNKIKNNLGIPFWIRKNKSLLRACIRGLFDTDGCMYELKPNWPGLFQLNFKNYDKRLIKDVREALLKLGFNVSKINHNQLYITRKNDIHKFYKEIGFSNQRLLNKYLEFSSHHSPVV